MRRWQYFLAQFVTTNLWLINIKACRRSRWDAFLFVATPLWRGVAASGGASARGGASYRPAVTKPRPLRA
jgi:hypothetical protein